MTLTELKYIVAVARERHFGRAAEACFSASPRCRWLSASSRTSWASPCSSAAGRRSA